MVEAMEIELKQSDEIWTKDDQRLGHPHRLYHRIRDINPALQLYADYVHVVSFEMGFDYYIPLSFLNGRNPDNDHITLKVPMKTVYKNTWNRIPDFVVHGDVEWEDLPGKPFDNIQTEI
jgi:hypothetical protein